MHEAYAPFLLIDQSFYNQNVVGKGSGLVFTRFLNVSFHLSLPYKFNCRPMSIDYTKTFPAHRV